MVVMDYSMKMPPSSSGERQTGSTTSSSLQKDTNRALSGWLKLGWGLGWACSDGTYMDHGNRSNANNQPVISERAAAAGHRAALPSVPLARRAIHDAGHCSLVSERAREGGGERARAASRRKAKQSKVATNTRGAVQVLGWKWRQPSIARAPPSLGRSLLHPASRPRPPTLLRPIEQFRFLPASSLHAKSCCPHKFRRLRQGTRFGDFLLCL